MPVRRNSQRCDITLDDLEGDDVGFTPPPPYSGRRNEEPTMNSKKLKKQWTSAALAVSEDEKKKKMEEVIKVWEGQGTTFKEFIDNTTVHGVKHIFEESPYRVRRILWVLCFLGALIFFLVQVTMRTKEYFKYKTNVDVQVKYVSSMEFPAVTICNQNSFRMTKVVDKGMYEFVDYVFATDMNDISMENYKKYNTVNSTDFLQDTAHQLEDMIDGCYYNTKKCDLTNDFKRTFTDMGICYTFNHDPNNIKMVTESGAGYGLRLILNVEQYQAMRGPQNDAGLKLLLHQQNEFPAVKNLGFSVAPGTHTLVGVYVKEVSGIEPPWGICSLSAEPLTNCKRQCKTDMVAENCQCVDVYMAGEGMAGAEEQNSEVCSLPDLWGCVRNVTDHLQTTGDTCDCPIPCNRTSYEPRLSYAQLSRINIDRLVLKNPTQKELAEENFELSLETLQRVDESIAKTDETTLRQLQETVSALESVLVTLNDTLGSGSGLEDVIKDMIQALDDDTETVDDFDDAMEDEIDELDKQKIDVTRRMFGYMYMMLGSPEDATESLQGAQGCVSLMTLELPYPDATNPEEVVERFTSGIDKHDWMPSYVSSSSNRSDSGQTGTPQDCNNQVKDIIEAVQEFYHIMQAALEYSRSFLNSYKGVVQSIYEGTLRNASSVEEHVHCIDFIEDEFEEVFEKDIEALLDAFDAVRKSRTKPELSAAFATLFDESMTTELVNYTAWYEDLQDKCWWMDAWMDSGDKFEDDLERGEDYFKMAGVYASGASTQVVKVTTQLIKMRDHISDDISYYTNLTALYLEKSITKLTMAEEFSDMEAAKLFEDLITQTTEYKSLWDTYDEKMRQIIANYKMGFISLLKMELPVIKRETLDEMKFLNLLKAINESHMTSLIDGIMGNTMVTFSQIEKCFVDTYLEEGSSSQREMSTKTSKISSQVSNLRAKMSTYVASAEIDQDFLLSNFLQVDVYFPEIGYDIITQHKAFEILSLFSEVGGFLGLLLGASVLSLIELVDYLVMLGTRKWKEKHQVNYNGVKKF